MMQSLASTSPLSIITGPILVPSNDCYMRYWLSMEGNSTGSLMIGGMNLDTGVVRPFWQSYPSMFPERAFGFQRRIIQISGMSVPFRLVIEGKDKLVKIN